MSLYDNYESLLKYLQSGKDKFNRPSPESNPKTTRIVADPGYNWVGVKLHNTVVVKHYKDGRIQLNSDGWQTVTTRERMNTFLPFFKWNDELKKHVGIGIRVFTDKRIMYCMVHSEYGSRWDNPNSKKYLYEDGMIINPDGTVTNQDGNPINPDDKRKEKSKRSELNRIKKFSKEFISKFINQEIGNPGAGDCWYCQSHIPGSGIPPIDTLTPEGIKPGFDETDHIRSHIKESYFVPSLLYNAIESQKSGLARIDQHNIAWCTKTPGWESHEPWAIDLTERRLKLLLTRYICKQLGYQVT